MSAELGLGSPVHNAVDHAMEIGARVDVVRDLPGERLSSGHVCRLELCEDSVVREAADEAEDDRKE